MKFNLSLSKTNIPKLELKIDNPGGSWLKEEQEYNEIKGRNKHGVPVRFGAITGVFNRSVLLPVDVLVKIPGMAGEQNDVRADSLEWLSKHMKRYKRLPLIQESKRHYRPFIMVYQDGTPYVNEGNHRIMAAKRLGFKYLPVELRYFSGGESVKGPLSPKEVKMHDADAHAAGFTDVKYGPTV